MVEKVLRERGKVTILIPPHAKCEKNAMTSIKLLASSGVPPPIKNCCFLLFSWFFDFYFAKCFWHSAKNLCRV